jgi:DNA polymerase III subunit beta
MRSTLNTERFRNALHQILSVVDKKGTKQILSYLLISGTDNVLTMTATDLEVSAKCSLEGNIEESGSFCVNAKNLFDILKELPNTNVELNYIQEENQLKVSCGDIHFVLLTYSQEEFPPLYFEIRDNSFSLNSDQLLQIINKTSFAISTDETRIFLNGLFLQILDNKLRAVSLDGYRLALLDTNLEILQNESLQHGIIIPRKGVAELKKLAVNYPNKNLTISVDDSFIYTKVEEEYFLTIRLIAREFPKYSNIIPNKTSFSLKTKREDLFDAVRRIKIMSNEKSNAIRVKLTEDEMIVGANNPALGNAVEKLNVEYTGKEMETGLNARYLIDTLNIFDDGDDVILEFNNEISPVLIRSSNMDNFLGIVMPLKL